MEERASWGWLSVQFIGIQLLEQAVGLFGDVCIAMCLKRGAGLPVQNLSGEFVVVVKSMTVSTGAEPVLQMLVALAFEAQAPHHREVSHTHHRRDDNLYLNVL